MRARCASQRRQIVIGATDVFQRFQRDVGVSSGGVGHLRREPHAIDDASARSIRRDGAQFIRVLDGAPRFICSNNAIGQTMNYQSTGNQCQWQSDRQ